MNLQQSDDELRLQTQQIDAAELDRGGRTPNPFAAALGIGSIVLLLWLLFALGPIFGRLIAFTRDAIGFGTSLFGSIRSADWPHQVSIGVAVTMRLRFTRAPFISAQAASIGRERCGCGVSGPLESLE